MIKLNKLLPESTQPLNEAPAGKTVFIVDEALTGPMSITKDRLQLMSKWAGKHLVDKKADDITPPRTKYPAHDANVIADRLLILLSQSHRSEEADRILSFLLK